MTRPPIERLKGEVERASSVMAEDFAGVLRYVEELEAALLSGLNEIEQVVAKHTNDDGSIHDFDCDSVTGEILKKPRECNCFLAQARALLGEK